ncbi:MAG: 2-succinyl-5-enolpyruvyl-6-hydroxy-3-cyclohexene-1-carboxylic-acid synthase [Spirulinaceae cyanobacterium SM2_1_0]|nr:2-succinyl-5-enolpyruvyl-6-hydroxy-3-cyclohexene-1-carboxylic-acid synthase [Spirulinaceae cyanobacterium SM2_1_0]
MGLDFRNANSLWAAVLLETWYRLGLRLAIISPGSRSTPLTVASAQHPGVEAIAILDERSAAFFALGNAKRTGQPVLLICTSGTAAANFYPAVIEASLSQVPLLVLSADRPPELRHCRAGQTIDQIKLYGHYPNWQAELATVDITSDRLCYLRQMAVQAWERSLCPQPGVVHLNVPLREPLAPLSDPDRLTQIAEFDTEAFFAAIAPPLLPQPSLPWPEAWQAERRGLIVAGLAHPLQPEAYCRAVAELAAGLGWPVLTDALSPLRHQAALNPYLVSTYDLILRNSKQAANLVPDWVIQIGELPTSKILRAWLQRFDPPRWLVATGAESLDPLQGRVIHLPVSVENLEPRSRIAQASSLYLAQWLAIATQARQLLDQELQALEQLNDSQVAALLPQVLPEATPLLIANSSPVRDVEYFWPLNSRRLQPFVNRGANGIDGTLSTALGLAHRSDRPTVLLTGDLALLHDTNGFLSARQLVGSLTIVLINNQGGGIFEWLAIAAFDPPFEEYFATPQAVDFRQLCATYGIDYHLIADEQQFRQLLAALPRQGVRLLEVRTERRREAQWRQDLFTRLAAALPAV